MEFNQTITLYMRNLGTRPPPIEPASMGGRRGQKRLMGLMGGTRGNWETYTEEPRQRMTFPRAAGLRDRVGLEGSKDIRESGEAAPYRLLKVLSEKGASRSPPIKDPPFDTA